MRVSALGGVKDNGVAPRGKRCMRGIIASQPWAVEELAARAGFCRC